MPAERVMAKKLRRFMKKELGFSASATKGRLVRLWDTAELRDVAWRQVEFSYQADGYAGTEFGNTLDRSTACSACGTGATVADPVRTDWKPKPKRGVHQLLTGEWVVNDAVRRAFQAADVSGVTYRELVSEAGDSLDGVSMLQPVNVAPRAHATAPLKQDKHCRNCGADGWGPAAGTELRFVYGAGQLPADLDVLWTFEAIGRWTANLGGKRSLLISKKAFDVLRKLKVRGLEFRPVEIVG